MTRLFVLMIMAFVAMPIFAEQSSQAPSVGGSDRSSIRGIPSRGKTIVPLSITKTGAAYFLPTSVIMAEKGPSGSWDIAGAKIRDDVLRGVLKTRFEEMAVPSDYAPCGGSNQWYNLCYVDRLTFPQSQSEWNAVIDPPSPMNNENGNPVWTVIEGESTNRDDSLSLADIQVIFSSPADNLLNATNTYETDTLTPLAFVIKSDGTVVTNKPATTKGEFLFMLVRSPLFNGAGIQSGLDLEKGYIGGFADYPLVTTVGLTADPSTWVSTTVSMHPTHVAQPVLKAISPGQYRITNADPNVTYIVQSKESLAQGIWHLQGVLVRVNTTDTFSVPASSQTQFIRVAVR